MPRKKNRAKPAKQEILQASTSALPAQEEQIVYNTTIQELLDIANNVQGVDQSLILNEFFQNIIFDGASNSNEVNYTTICKQIVANWQERAKQFLSDTDFTYEHYNKAITLLTQEGKMTNLNHAWGFTFTKLLVAIYYELTIPEDHTVKIVMLALRNIALTKIIDEYLINPLTQHNILPGTIPGIDKHKEFFYLPDGKKVSFQDTPIILLNPNRELNYQKEMTMKIVSCGKPSVFYNQESIPHVINILVSFANQCMAFGSPVNDFKGEQISVNFIKNAFNEIKKTSTFKNNSDEATLAFIIAFIGFFNIYAKNDTKTLQDFENDFIKFLKSYTWKTELNNISDTPDVMTDLSPFQNYEKLFENLTSSSLYNTKIIKLKYNNIYKLVLSFSLVRHKFDEKEDAIIADAAFNYFALLEEERKKTSLSAAPPTKPVNINQNGEAYLCIDANQEKEAAPILTDTQNITVLKESVADQYLDNIVTKAGAMDIILKYLEDKRNGMEIKGIKRNFINFSAENMKIIVDLNPEKPIIFVFNKAKINISDKQLEILTATAIDYHGIGRNGKKININEKKEVAEVHIKFWKDGERYTLPSTYHTETTLGETPVTICYLDREMGPEEWHVTHRMNAPQHLNMPRELQSIFTPQSSLKVEENLPLKASPALTQTWVEITERLF